MKNFMTDKDGVSISDFEKLTLGCLLIACVAVLLVVYWKKNIVDTNMVYLTATLGSLFVIRKGLKYFTETKTQQMLSKEATSYPEQLNSLVKADEDQQ